MEKQEVIIDFSKQDVDQEIVLDFSQVTTLPRPKLSPEQEEARDNPGNTLVIACPGAGKTEILTQRAELNEKQGRRSLCLTFTIAAAAEMKRRVPLVEARTIHSFCHTQIGWRGEYPKMLKDYILHGRSDEYDEVLVDETQNLTPLMLTAIRRIPKKSLFAVGDPYQSCYIGAWAANLFDKPALGPKAFEELARSCQVKEIQGNRRSNEHIIKLLNILNPRKLIPLGPKKLNNTLICTRTHNELRLMSELLVENDIPHVLYKKRSDKELKYEVFGHNPRVDLLVLHQMIGTEYHRVFIVDYAAAPAYKENSENEETEAFNLLYTAVARAAEEVYTLNRSSMGLCSYLPEELDIDQEEMLDMLKED